MSGKANIRDLSAELAEFVGKLEPTEDEGKLLVYCVVLIVFQSFSIVLETPISRTPTPSIHPPTCVSSHIPSFRTCFYGPNTNERRARKTRKNKRHPRLRSNPPVFAHIQTYTSFLALWQSCHGVFFSFSSPLNFQKRTNDAFFFEILLTCFFCSHGACVGSQEGDGCSGQIMA